MQEEDLEQPDDMNGEIEEEEVDQAPEARVQEIVSDRNFKRIKFALRETTLNLINELFLERL